MKVFIYWTEKCLGIADYPVCHSCTCDCSAILFPVFFLTTVWKTVTELLVHDPCNRTRRCHAIKHMRISIFPFYKWNILFTAFWTAVIKAIDFNHFQLCRNKDQLTANKLFTDLNQWCITDRANFIFVWKIKIFLCYRNPLETPGIRCSVFLFLDTSAESVAASSSASAAAGPCSRSALLKRFNCPGKGQSDIEQ